MRHFALDQASATFQWWEASGDGKQRGRSVCDGGTPIADVLSSPQLVDLASRPGQGGPKVKSVRLGSIESVVKGKTTTVFAKRAGSAPEGRCMSLMVATGDGGAEGNRSSIDIELPSQRDRDALAQGFVLLGVPAGNFVVPEYELYHMPAARRRSSAVSPTAVDPTRRSSLLAGSGRLPATVVAEVQRSGALESLALHRRVGAGQVIGE